MVAAIVPGYASLFVGDQRGTRALPVHAAAMKGRA